MNKKSVCKKALAFCLSLVLVMGLAAAPCAAAATLTDIKGHWAETAIRYGVTAGYISGYEDGTFKPNRTVTRAQFAKMLNNAIGLQNTVSIKFSDVASSAWYYDEVRKAVSAEYITGYEDGTFKPNNTITRLQTAVMISRVLPRPAVMKSSTTLADTKAIPDWARDSVNVVFSKGYMKGDEKNKFNPYTNLTRAQAAQIIYLMLKGETIVTSSAISADTIKTGTLFSNNVTVTASSGTGTVSLQNCRVLGALTIDGTDPVTLSDTAANYLAVVTEDAEVLATGQSQIKDTIVKSGSTLKENALTGSGFENVTLSGSALEASTVKLSGSFDKLNVEASTVISQTGGTIADLEVPSKVSSIIQKGSITALNVAAGGAGSTITLAKGVTVGTATMNGAATFFGDGTITRAVENVTGVTYETKPGTITANVQTPTTGVLLPTVVPIRGASSVDPAASVSVVFSEDFTTAGGAAVSAAYAGSSVVELRQGSTSGTLVSCAVTVSGRTIVMTPVASLNPGALYYVVVKGSSLQNSSGQLNTAYSSYFYTRSAAASTLTPTVTPSNGTTGVALSAGIILTFDDILFNSAGNTLTSSYVEGSVIELRQGSSTGTLVSYTSSISTDRKTITLTPDQGLAANTVYYVIVKGSTIKNSAGTLNPQTVTSFTTGNSTTLTPTVSPANGATYVSKTGSIYLTFGEAVYQSLGVTLTPTYVRNTVVELHKGSADGDTVGFTAAISTDKRTLTVTPSAALADNTIYYVVVNRNTLVNAGGSYNSRFVSRFSTGSRVDSDITFLPASGATGVSAGGTVTLTFPAVIYRTGYTSLKASYLESTAIQLRRGSASGTAVDLTASVSTDGKTVTLKPNSDLDMSTTYYVLVTANTLDYSDGSQVGAASSYFTTADSNPVTLTLNSADVSSTSAAFSVKTDVAGTLTVSYSGGNRNLTLVSGYLTSAGGTRTFSLTDLTVGTTYTVYASLVYNGLTYTRSTSFTTTSSSVTTTLREMRLTSGSDTYSVIDTTNNSSGSFTVYPAASAGAKLTMLPTESSVSAVEYRMGSDYSTAFTALTRDSSGYYTIPNLTFTKGQTLTLQVRVTAENTSYNRTYTVSIVCNY